MKKILNVKFNNESAKFISPLNFEEFILESFNIFKNKLIFNCNCYLDDTTDILLSNNNDYTTYILKSDGQEININLKIEKKYDLPPNIIEIIVYLTKKKKELESTIIFYQNIFDKEPEEIKINEFQKTNPLDNYNTINFNNNNNKFPTDIGTPDNKINYIGLNCKYLNKDSEKTIYLSKIKKDVPIIHTFNIQNSGSDPFPNDTILKCDNSIDTDIFFYPTNINVCVMSFDEKNGVYYKVEVLINFQSYKNIKPKEYNLKAYLVSDSKGRIGDEDNFCTFKLKVIDK